MAKNKRKIKNTCFYLASFHKIIVPTNCSRVDNRFSIRIRNSDPIESARIAFNHRPWNNLFSTSHAHWIRDSTRRFNSKKKKKKKKRYSREETRGCNDYPLQALHVYRYAYIHTKRTVRWNPLSVRIYTMLDEKKRTVGLPCCAQRNVKILPRASDLNDAAGICARSKSYACVIG